MPGDELLRPYLILADELSGGRVSETDLPSACLSLPPLGEELVEALAGRAEDLAKAEPRRGWAISQIAFQASLSQDSSVFVKSLAAWHLGRACNHWVQPRRVEAAIAVARVGFESLGLPGWIAACDWQAYALPWTKPNFTRAVEILQDALERLERAGFSHFIPEARLALAYAQILTVRHEAALENILASERVYTLESNDLARARCWLNRASSLRRQDRFEEAQDALDRAIEVFDQEGATVDQAKAYYQIAVGHLLKGNELRSAEVHFEKAAGIFLATDMEVWRAMCLNSLGAVMMMSGQLKLADRYYEEAGDCFTRHEIVGMLADNLNDRGKLNVLIGKPARSVDQLRQAEAINREIGSELSAAFAISNLGEAYAQLGRYQDALFHLERAIERLKLLKSYFRLATCEKYAALVWSRLGRWDAAHDYLDQAAMHYELANQTALLSSVHSYRAAAFFQQGLYDPAISSLGQAITAAEKHGLRPLSALAKRLLGEVYLQVKDEAQAGLYLEQAQTDFQDMGMAAEYAACRVAIGTLQQQHGQARAAHTAFEEALQLSEGVFPEIAWRASIEMGHLAEGSGDIRQAIDYFRSGITALNQIRQNFLQPSVAGSYLQTPAQALDKIISLCAQADAVPDVLHFIEEAKASTLLRQLAVTGPTPKDPGSRELSDLKAEIDLLRSRLKVSPDEPALAPLAFRAGEMRAQLHRMTDEYDRLKARLERSALSEAAGPAISTAFNLDLFRKTASSRLGENWAALDCYMAANELVIVMVTPRDCTVSSRPVSPRLLMALDACDRTRQRAAEPLLASDLQILGQALIPDALVQALSPDTTLLISPHRRLHQVPWPALRPASAGQPLVALCVPSLIPSLQGLQLLWKRDLPAARAERASGLLVGLSTFNGVHGELPHVRDEVSLLRSRLGAGSRVLLEDEATWGNLLSLWETAESPRFDWLHIASHFIPDRHTGRMSAIAFHDGDIWLDQFRDLAPLPRLVSLSTCNSNDSFLYEGEERMDLQTICFLGGASTIVGSAWPVLDRSAAELIDLFYGHYLSGLAPARAAAHSQRELLQNGKEPGSWASFVCAGIP